MSRKDSAPETNTIARRRLPKGLAPIAIALASGLLGGVVGSSKNSLAKPTTASSSIETSKKLLEAQNQIDMLEEQNRIDNLKLQDQIEALSAVIAAQAGVDIETVERSHPKPESLPGYGQKVSPETREAFEASVIKMGKRPKGTTGNWEEVCTGNKVSYNNQTFVTTAAHCLVNDISYEYNSGKGGGSGASDITEASSYDYAILDANTPSAGRVAGEVAKVTRVAVSNSGTDLALFTVENTPEFLALGALDIYNETPPALPGVEVALRSLPASNNNEPVETNGTYLGRIYNAFQVGSYSTAIDVVGIKGVDADSADPCMYGASGSASMTADKVALLSLSSRHQVDPYSNGTYDAQQDRDTALLTTFLYEQALDVSLAEFDTVCGFAVSMPGDMDALLNAEPMIEVPVEYQDGK